MCVIAYKAADVAFPSKSILKNCFNNNPDGGGFMFAVNNRVHIVKGLMSFSAFYSALKQARTTYGDSIPYVLHFRISTQAGTRPDCTHPYPLSANMDHLRKLENKCRIGIAHNGIISLTSTGGYYKTITYNDTMKFITDYLTLIIKNKDYYKDKNTLLLIKRLADSRLAILDDAGHCELIGEGWTVDNGVYYSNTSYKPPKKPKKTTRKGGGFAFGGFSGLIPDFYEDDYIDDFTQRINEAYDENTGLYNFDMLDCPCITDGDDSFCELCEHYPQCYSTHTTKGGNH